MSYNFHKSPYSFVIVLFNLSYGNLFHNGDNGNPRVGPLVQTIGHFVCSMQDFGFLVEWWNCHKDCLLLEFWHLVYLVQIVKVCLRLDEDIWIVNLQFIYDFYWIKTSDQIISSTYLSNHGLLLHLLFLLWQQFYVMVMLPQKLINKTFFFCFLKPALSTFV